MALIRIFGGGQISGSIGANTYAHNRYGQYARGRSIPVNPNTPAQSAVRAAFTGGVSAWKALSAANRSLWEAYASNTPWTNKLGETVYLTGQAMFVGSYSYSQIIGAAAITSPPTADGQAPISTWPTIVTAPTGDPSALGSMGLTSSATTQTGLTANTLYLDYDSCFEPEDPADIQGALLQGRLTDASVNFCNGPWTDLDVYSADIATTLLVLDVQPIFGSVTSGKTLHLRLNYRDATFRRAPYSRNALTAITYTD